MIAKQAFLAGPAKTIPDFVPISGCLSMCQEARDLLESFEPGINQFFRVDVTRKRSEKPIFRIDGRVLDEPYYLLNVTTLLDAVWIERSQVKIGPYPMPDGKPGARQIVDNYNIVLRKSVIDGHHIWKGCHYLPGKLFFSDALVAAIEAKRLRKLEFHHLDEA